LSKDIEYRIEQFLRFPEELTAKEYAEVKDLITSDHKAKITAEWLTEFYGEYDTLAKPDKVVLLHHRYNPKTSGPMVLAAMTEEKKNTNLVTKATFASEEHKTLLRILEDHQKHEYQFHVISKYVGAEDRVLIEIEETGLELISRKGGLLKQVRDPKLSDINWEEALALLRIPLSKCEFKTKQKSLTVCDECTITVQGNTCLIDVLNTSVTRVVVEQMNKTELYYIDSKTLEIEIERVSDLSVYLYS
jgi:hypothetical protein